MTRLEVAVAAPLEQTLSYEYSSAEHSYSALSLIGRRVLVPLGGRRVTGYVLAIQPEKEEGFALRQVIQVLDSKPLFHPNIIPFFRWIAGYYHYPLGEVIKTALPAGLTSESAKKIVLTEYGKDSLEQVHADSNQPQWMRRLIDRGELSVGVSRKLLRDNAEKKLISTLEREGYVHIVEQLRRDDVREKQEVCYTLAIGMPPGDYRDEQIGLDLLRKNLLQEDGGEFKKAELKAIYWLKILGEQSGNPVIPQKDLLQRYPNAMKATRSLVERGYVRQSLQRVFRNPYGCRLESLPRPQDLMVEQSHVLEKITEGIDAQKFGAYLLHGITGSGKTEVYLRAAEKAIAMGRDVLVLVPEIALASQLESHFVSRFGDQVVLLHSGLTPSERYDQWSLAASGKAKVVVGARSAVFAPLQNPGLIVVDEEHDTGYKQDDSLRYNGRDLAIFRAREHNAAVVLGSATPSLTSYYNASVGKYTLLKMTERVAGRSMPTVSLVDLRKKAKTDPKGLFRSELREALAQNLRKNEQSLLLLNRRGFSTHVVCKECGAPVECVHCHVSLVFHKKRRRLICHYCGYSLTDRIVCGSCMSDNLVPIGFGTEKIEEEAKELFPDARIARLDSDTVADRRNFLRILKAVHDRELDILVGTQMIAKGHHFPDVTLVGVVWADGGLNMPDFRAAERTFQLISQVTGRAGRGENPGRVIVQTMQPEHYSIVLARDHQYEKFFQQEMAIRKNPVFPPFVRLISFIIHGTSENDVRRSAVGLVAKYREIIKQATTGAAEGNRPFIEMLGPAPAPIDRICDRYRWSVLLKGRVIDELHRVCRAAMDDFGKICVGDTRIAVDVDPENMM